MVFTAPIFLVAFLPFFLLLYAVLPSRFSNPLMLTASVAFYAWGGPVFVFFAVGSALLDLVLVRLIAASGEARRRRDTLAETDDVVLEVAERLIGRASHFDRFVAAALATLR